MHEEVLEHAPALLAFLLQVQVDGLEMHLQHKFIPIPELK